MKYLIHFEDDEALDPGVVGHKFSSLARATRSGFAVPPAVCIRVEANRRFRRTGSWPEGLFIEVRDVAKELGLAEGLSVRSSATREDLQGRSFAGQYKTFLNVKTEADVKEKIVKCWQSADSERVKSYLDDEDGRKEPPLMAVVLQRMVDAIAAGVAFSRNPMFPLRDEVVIESTEGLGEDLVSGRITPHRVFVQGNGGIRFDHPIQRDENSVGVLKKKQWKKIAAMARRAEAHAGGEPRDIEWAMDRGKIIWLLQSRPVTNIRSADLRAPPGTWTRKIVDDLWADRLTPLLADVMIRNAHRFDLSTHLKLTGIPVATPTLAAINGFLYVNCESLKQILTLIPARFRLEDMRSLFPVGFEIDSALRPPVSKLILILFRSVLLVLLTPRGNPLFCNRLSRSGLKKLVIRLGEVERLPGDSPAEAFYKLRASIECLALLLERNQWPYFYATAFTWALRWIVVDLYGLGHGDFLRLLGSKANNITIEIEKETRKIAESIKREGSLLSRFLEENPEHLVDSLPGSLQQKIDRFLSKYGCRAPHRTLYVKRWAEAPEAVLGMISTLLRNWRKGELPETSKVPLPWLVRLGLRPFLHFALIFLDLREDLRFFLDRILYLIRRSLMALGERTGLNEDTLFLTQPELEQVVDGKMSLQNAKSLISSRRDEFLEQAGAYTFYIDGRPIDELPSRAGLIKGIGTSPGRTTGRARIVDDPTQAGIRKGDILIAKNTDPGWTPVLRTVSGIVVEEGGILNHCSIVARELGIPAVVGVRQATRKIPEGTIITIDGSLGIIQIA